MKCIVCGESRYKTGVSYITSGVAFHHFPKDRGRTLEWLQCINKPLNKIPATCDGVCSKHFRDSDYQFLPRLNLEMDRTHVPRGPLLKSTAKPTLEQVFERNWCSQTEPKVASQSTNVRSQVKRESDTEWSNPQTQTSNLSFKCDTCEYSCDTKSEIVSHSRYHLGESPNKLNCSSSSQNIELESVNSSETVQKCQFGVNSVKVKSEPSVEHVLLKIQQNYAIANSEREDGRIKLEPLEVYGYENWPCQTDLKEYNAILPINLESDDTSL